MNTITPYQRKIAYYETDQMKIVHHSNYIRWMEEARMAFMDEIGLSYAQMEQEKILIPVLSAACEYKVAMRFGQTFQIKMRIEKFNGIKFEVSYDICDAATGQLHAKGTSSHCFTDDTLMPMRCKKERPDIYEKMMKYVV